MIAVHCSNRQSALQVDQAGLTRTVELVLRGEGIVRGEISLALVDDPTIHQLNRQYLNHDYPTDVLSFPLDAAAGFLEGELIVSTETAIENAREHGLTPVDELRLYVIHGALHLAGYDDHDPRDRARMRDREQHYFQLTQPLATESTARPDPSAAQRGGGTDAGEVCRGD